MADGISGTAGGALVDVVKTLQAALAQVRSTAKGSLGITLVSAEVQLTVVRGHEKKIGGDWKIVSAQLRKEYSEEQELTLSLHPKAAAGALGEDESDKLAKAILDLTRAVRDILPKVAAQFEIPTFGVSTGVEVNSDGSLQVVAGGSREKGSSNRIALTFRFT
jgi:hypothetical protein